MGLVFPEKRMVCCIRPINWDLRTQNTVLFGQAYTTNALQLTNAVAVIANKGVKKPQRIIKAISDAEGHSEEQKPEGEATRVIDEQVASQVMNAMESVSDHYSQFRQSGWLPCRGKVRYRGSCRCGRTSVVDYQRLFCDYPADNPRFVVTVVLKDPQGGYGGLTAGPVTAEIGEFLMQKYEVPASSPRTDAIPVTW